MKALIITAYIENINKIDLNQFNDYFVIAADGGYKLARDNNIKIDKIIGDMDSFDEDSSILPKDKTFFLPKEKDFTDTEAALDNLVKNNYDEIIILGGLGGRVDHTFGNIFLLNKYIDCNISIIDGKNIVKLYKAGSYKISKYKDFKYISLLPFSEKVENVNLEGCKYPIKNLTLTNASTLSISNEITSNEANLSFVNGYLLLVQATD